MLTTQDSWSSLELLTKDSELPFLGYLLHRVAYRKRGCQPAFGVCAPSPSGTRATSLFWLLPTGSCCYLSYFLSP